VSDGVVVGFIIVGEVVEGATGGSRWGVFGVPG